MDKKSIASYVLDKVKSLGVDDAECCVSEKIVTEIYYESGKVSMVRTNFNNALSLKVIKDKKKGSSAINSLEQEDIDEAINDAVNNASESIADDAEGICDEAVKEDFCKGYNEADRTGLYDKLSEFINDTHKKYPLISFDSITANHIYAYSLYMNTNGTEIAEDNSYYEFSPMYMACKDGKTSSFNASEALFSKPEIPFINLGMTNRLLDETQHQIETRTLQGKFSGPVIFTPPCVEDILSMIEDNFLSDSVLINGTSLFKNSIGKKVASDMFTVNCIPVSYEIVAGYRMNSDGYVTENMPLIEKGILKNFVLSRYGAAKTGLRRSSCNGGCYVVDNGDISLEDMIKGIDRGLIVNRFSGGAPGVDGGITGVAKNSFLIENGKICDSVSETMISGNLVQMLLSISQISKERVNNGVYILPWIKIDDITISGK